MPDRPTLSASSRDIVGKKVARLRRAGRMPAVVFGHGDASTPVSVDAHEFEVLRRHIGATALIDLSIDGERVVPVMVHGMQRHRVTQRVLHVDLFAVRMSEEMVLDAPLVGTGEAPAVALGGTLVHQLTSLKVKALPAAQPEALYFDLSALVDYDAMITVADLALPSGVTLLHSDLTEVVARVLPPRVVEAEVGASEEAPAEVVDAAAAGSGEG